MIWWRNASRFTATTSASTAHGPARCSSTQAATATWLKWHRARRRGTDPVFTARILQAMRLGASVEVDLVVHGSDGFAVLHNLTLEEETTGTGAVRATDAATLRALHLRDNAGQALPDPG